MGRASLIPLQHTASTGVIIFATLHNPVTWPRQSWKMVVGRNRWQKWPGRLSWNSYDCQLTQVKFYRGWGAGWQRLVTFFQTHFLTSNIGNFQIEKPYKNSRKQIRIWNLNDLLLISSSLILFWAISRQLETSSMIVNFTWPSFHLDISQLSCSKKHSTFSSKLKKLLLTLLIAKVPCDIRNLFRCSQDHKQFPWGNSASCPHSPSRPLISSSQ